MYRQESLIKVVNDVRARKRTIQKASEFYAVLKSSAGDRIKEEENIFVEGIGICAEGAEFEIRKIIQMYLNRKEVQIKRFPINFPGPVWMTKVLEKNKNLTSRLPQNIKRNRARLT